MYWMLIVQTIKFFLRDAIWIDTGCRGWWCDPTPPAWTTPVYYPCNLKLNSFIDIKSISNYYIPRELIWNESTLGELLELCLKKRLQTFNLSERDFAYKAHRSEQKIAGIYLGGYINCKSWKLRDAPKFLIDLMSCLVDKGTFSMIPWLVCICTLLLGLCLSLLASTWCSISTNWHTMLYHIYLNRLCYISFGIIVTL